MSEELKACPFCGSADHLRIVTVGVLTGDMPDRPHRVICSDIGHDDVQGPVDYGRIAAITAWNTRAADAENQRLRAEVDALREALVAEREENLWSAYATGHVKGDEWTHLFMSDGEWLAKECGLDPRQGYYNAEEIRNAIPIAAREAITRKAHQ